MAYIYFNVSSVIEMSNFSVVGQFIQQNGGSWIQRNTQANPSMERWLFWYGGFFDGFYGNFFEKLLNYSLLFLLF